MRVRVSTGVIEIWMLFGSSVCVPSCYKHRIGLLYGYKYIEKRVSRKARERGCECR